MTNWMTAAGLAFIAGGLATLISFRAVLFGGGDGGERGTRGATPAVRRRSAEPARPAPEPEFPQGDVEPVDNHPGRRRRLAEAFGGRAGSGAGRSAGLASIGLADDDEYADELEPRLMLRSPHTDRPWQGEPHAEPGGAHPWYDEDEDHVPEDERDYDYPEAPGYDADPLAEGESSRFIDNAAWRAIPRADEADPLTAGDNNFRYDDEPYPRSRPEPIDRSDRGYGDRIDGWVRPRYRDLDDRPPAGDYWTPVPGDLYADPEPSARGYGWPVPVERLPAVPDYEPATGFDLTPVQAAEPTTLVPAWPPPAPDHQIRLPRSWATRDSQARSQSRGDREHADFGRGGDARTGKNPDEPSWNDSRRSRAVADPEPPRGPRPRPRPHPAAAAPEPDSNYVSRHSAGPHR